MHAAKDPERNPIHVSTYGNYAAQTYPSCPTADVSSYDLTGPYQSPRPHSTLLQGSSLQSLRYDIGSSGVAEGNHSMLPTHFEPCDEVARTAQLSAPPRFRRVGGDRPYDLVYDDTHLGLDSVEAEPVVVFSDIPVNGIIAPKPVSRTSVLHSTEDEVARSVRYDYGN